MSRNNDVGVNGKMTGFNIFYTDLKKNYFILSYFKQ